ncbi:hydrogenase nickel incorporation protein HypB [Yersinia mollaretii]|uniref:Hydrogenase maturation factor HypB n=1 Tax=Yersinia mollaretii TaxID=33060 RepID=A0AA44CPC0_YERMO|nr:hydrogenase nickel incorporation protein HypB [Yersinia mollaretii]NIL24291.1 hydrogenase nickel incorporation protein HypB [Yersinia mollaretii]CNJ21241.1 hydrogenase isoenzymes nickel incorporation protein [Yersinia mollaretii]CQR14944.1 hydrogenase isoenzymes nickel incorporation protein [Yersinia mollaretii]
MCTTCGCASGERKIEGDDSHHHDDHHHDDHHHDDHHHDHHHHHDGGHHHEHGPHDSETHATQIQHKHKHNYVAKGTQPVIVHHHYYYHQGDVHHHYHGKAPDQNLASEPLTTTEPDDTDAPVTDTFTPQLHADQQGLHYGQGEAGSHAPGMGQRRLLQIEQDVLSKNNQLASHNRAHFVEQHILALNLVSSPGSGKTTLLTTTLQRLAGQVPCAVIEGDQQTTHDAERIRATGVPAIQVNTGKGCHLDAQMVHDAAHRLGLNNDSLLFIENVGNLVCPASFDLGERHKVAVLSVTEGEDKPLKYPHMFAASTLMIINKIDLLPYLDFDIDQCIAYARQVNPEIQVIALSASSGEGMDLWLEWLETQRCA